MTIAGSKIIKSLGLVFGDIGTSPIYTLGAILLFILPTVKNVLGLLSLIIWSLFFVITVQYAWLAMHLGVKGEGGTIVLKGLLISYLKKNSRMVSLVSLLTIVGVALFMGDGVITPAISILSAVEGIQLIPGFQGIGSSFILLIAIVIACGLFIIQKRGTERIAWAFGPIMLIWFLTLTITGILSILSAPEVLFAVSPQYAVSFLWENGFISFFVLSAVVLCVTGGEALYADMGHLGKEPIISAWYLVFPALVISYLGQGAFVLTNPEVHSVLFNMIKHESVIFYVPFLVLSIAATVIASQAMISGMFSIVYQGMTTHLLPKLRIDFTSPDLRSQIYIDTVNWLLLFAVIIVMVDFGTSENLASAYGLAVTGTMTISAILMTLIFIQRHDRLKTLIALFLIGVDGVFLFSAFLKFPSGAYWSVFIAAIPLLIILIFIKGQERLHAVLQPVELATFLPQFQKKYASLKKVEGTAVFFTRDPLNISSYIFRTIIKDEIIFEDNILVSIKISEAPFGITTEFDQDLVPGLHSFHVTTGYMEVINLEKILREHEIDERVIFYGIENIISRQAIWIMYGAIKRLTPDFVQFYSLPSDKIHGVITRIEM
ncbi:MAG: potassium transporter Kup [Methanomicrobiales archaeon HGW-Methanomicrobiales-1]|jgi:KUP system potassium uptake protein|nr:MAG: potassium transporter Kup [Methanomicrobiales archaeon HGW-Methanomicrobiales-1]